MGDTVLVTGGFGLVGSETVRQLTAAGRQVAVADLDTPANRKKAKALPDGARPHWADLTDQAAVDRLVSEVSPSVIVHLAAVIPPPLYRNPSVARKVNVEATIALVRAAEAQPDPPRFVQASSNAVYGSRNPHRVTDVVRADTPPRPFELYSNTKFEAEKFVRASSSSGWCCGWAACSARTSVLAAHRDGIFIEARCPPMGAFTPSMSAMSGARSRRPPPRTSHARSC
jgi:nucleoside-diphosphate-sugar epimerase